MEIFDKDNPLLSLEQQIDREAQEYKRRRLQEEIAKLAAEKSAAVFPPQGDGVPPHPDAPDGTADDGGKSRR